MTIWPKHAEPHLMALQEIYQLLPEPSLNGLLREFRSDPSLGRRATWETGVRRLTEFSLARLLRELSIVRLRQGRQDRLHARHKSHTKGRYCIPKMGICLMNQ